MSLTFFTIDMLVESVIRGLVFAVVAIMLYVAQKDAEMRGNRRNMADILQNEIGRVLEAIPSRERERIDKPKSTDGKIVFVPRVYWGLLQTGNIQFFDKGLQDCLHEWYDDFENFPFSSLNGELGADIMTRLDQLKARNKSYAHKFLGKIPK